MHTDMEVLNLGTPKIRTRGKVRNCPIVSKAYWGYIFLIIQLWGIEDHVSTNNLPPLHIV